MKIKKYVLFLFMGFGMTPVFCMAQEIAKDTFKSGDFTYYLDNDGTASIAGWDGTDTDVEIPSELDGYLVTSVGDEAFSFCGIKSVKLPDSIKAVGEKAFADCVLLKSVEIPESVTTIKEYAFWDCCDLESITLPNSISIIEANTFRMTNLRSIEIPNSVLSIEEQAFYNCNRLESVKIANSVESVGEESFGKCYRLTKIEIPKSVKEIGKDAFIECNRLSMIVEKDSYAEQYAEENGITYSYFD